MAFGSSAVFGQFLLNPLSKRGTGVATGYTDLEADNLKAALYGNSGTPDKNAAVGLTGYGAVGSAWATGNEVVDTGGSNWNAKGRAISGAALSSISNGVMFDATDTAGGGNVTIANAYGCLVYDDDITAGTVADQGICFNYFGGAQSVTAGTFTIVWNASGLFQITAS